jgi:hypothetical protein
MADLAIQIGLATRLEPERVSEVVTLALEELHRLTIVDEKGPTAAVMEACFSFGSKAAFHLIGLYASEHDYHGRNDDAVIWNEVAMRFIPETTQDECKRIARWFAEKTADRLRLDAARGPSMAKSEADGSINYSPLSTDSRGGAFLNRAQNGAPIRDWEESILDAALNAFEVLHQRGILPRKGDGRSIQQVEQPMTPSGMVDGPSPIDTLERWEQHLAKLRQLPSSDIARDREIQHAEQMIEMKRRGS